MEQNCLVCDANVNISSSVNVNSTTVKYSNQKLATIVVNVLGSETPVSSNSSVCGKCYNLFKLYEQAQWTVKNTRREILKIYQSKVNNVTADNEQQDTNRVIVEKPKIEPVKFTNKFVKIQVACKPSETRKTYSLKNYFENAAKNLAEKSGENDHSYEKVSSSTSEQDIMITLANDTDEQERTLPVDIKKTAKFKGAKRKTERNKIGKIVLEEEQEDSNDSLDLDFKNLKPVKPKPPQSLDCPSCKKKCQTKSELRLHVKSHSELKPFMCEICGHSYRHKQALEIHIGMHNGVNPFQCSNCGKCFTQKGTLSRHMMIHSGETRYQCEICGKRFVHHTSYNMHILSHTREKAYKCSVCNLSLLSTSHLTRHMRVHTGEKPYGCPVCLKRFAQRYNLLSHQKTHNSTKQCKSRLERRTLKQNEQTKVGVF